MKIEKAIKKAIPFLGCLYGKSGSGKTYSALKLATGLANGGKICLLDTENGRASYYAEEFNFDVVNLEQPFHPLRYLEAVTMVENAGYSVLIIDSISHEWEGIGGCIEMADNATSASGKSLTGLQKWVKVKAQHKKLMQGLLSSKMHIIFCCRAKDLMEQEGFGPSAIIRNRGLAPMQEKNFIFEMLMVFLMKEGGLFTIEKSPHNLKETIINLKIEKLNEECGKAILHQINSGKKIDDKDVVLTKIRNDGMDIAMLGEVEKLKEWFASLSKDEKALTKDSGLLDELKHIAIQYQDNGNSSQISATSVVEVNLSKVLSQ